MDNLANNRNLVFTGYNQSGTTVQGAGFYYLDPRKFSLSAALKF